MLDRHRLPNEAAHRCPDHVCLRNAKHIQQSHRVRRHIRKRVRDRRQVAGEHTGQVRNRGIRQVCREPDVTVIEADHLQPVFNQNLAKRIRPVNGLRANSHNQQHRRRVGIPLALVADVDPAGPDV